MARRIVQLIMPVMPMESIKALDDHGTTWLLVRYTDPSVPPKWVPWDYIPPLPQE